MNKAILCIDDELHVLTSLRSALVTQYGTEYDIELAQNGEEALELVEKLQNEGTKLELIICDLMMPEMSGDVFLIKAHAILPKTKKILLTGRANIRGVTNAINAGALYRYISKPWEQSDFYITVKEALDSFEKEERLARYTKDIEEKNNENKTYMEIIDRYLIASKTDANGEIIDVSQALCDLSGYTKKELIGQKHNILRHPDMPEGVFKGLWGTVKAGKDWDGLIKNRKKNGEYYWVQSHIAPRFDKDNNIIGYASIRIDVTDKKRVEELSITDELTGLYNRRHFNEVFHKEILRARREKKKIGFSIFDIDYFKQYNDTYGHLMGDDVLKTIAKLLKKNLKRGSDCAFRLGGEEFGLLIYDTNLDSFRNFIETIMNSFYESAIPHATNPVSKYITASFGGCVFEGNTKITIDGVYNFADNLLYEIKSEGKNNLKIVNFVNDDS